MRVVLLKVDAAEESLTRDDDVFDDLYCASKWICGAQRSGEIDRKHRGPHRFFTLAFQVPEPGEGFSGEWGVQELGADSEGLLVVNAAKGGRHIYNLSPNCRLVFSLASI